jgi:hypothetical protein
MTFEKATHVPLGAGRSRKVSRKVDIGGSGSLRGLARVPTKRDGQQKPNGYVRKGSASELNQAPQETH